MIPGVLARQALRKKYTVTMRDESTGKTYDVDIEADSKPTGADLEGLRLDFEKRIKETNQKPRTAASAATMGASIGSQVGTKSKPNPGTIAELANLGGSKPYVKAKDTFKENERKKRERELDPQQTFDVLNETGKRIQEGVTNMVPSLDKIPGGRFAQKIAPGIIGPGDKGYAGHAAGLAGSVAATPVDIAADVVKFVSTGEWQAAANILLKTGAIVPVGKGVVAAGTSLASKTKAGRGLGVAKAMAETASKGMSEQQALATLTRLGASKQVALQAIKAAKTADTVSAPVAGSISNVAGAKRAAKGVDVPTRAEPDWNALIDARDDLTPRQKEAYRKAVNNGDDPAETWGELVPSMSKEDIRGAVETLTNLNVKDVVQLIESEKSSRWLFDLMDRSPVAVAHLKKLSKNSEDLRELLNAYEPKPVVNTSQPVAINANAASKELREYKQAVSERAPFWQARAAKGGETGANGEWYEGGKFIATTPETKKGEFAKVRKMGEARERSALPPNQTIIRPPMAGAGTKPAGRDYNGPIELFLNRHPATGQPWSPEELTRIDEAIAWWNDLAERASRGEPGLSWKDTRGTGELVVDTDLLPEHISPDQVARYIAKGVSIPDELVSKAKEFFPGLNIDRYQELVEWNAQRIMRAEQPLVKASAPKTTKATPQPSPSSIPETPQPKPLTGGKVDMGYKPVRSTPGQAPDVSGVEDAVNVPNLPGALPQIRTTNVDWKRGINVDDPRLNPQSDEFSPAFLSATHRAVVGGDIDPFADINDVYQDVYTALKNRGAEDAGDKAARASAMGDALKDVQGLLKRPKLSEMEQERLDALKGVTARKYRIAYKDKNGNWRYDDRQKPNMVDLSGMPKDVAEDILDFALANADDERYYVNRSMLDEYRRTGANKPSYLRESEFILRDVPNAEEAFRAVGESSNILIPRHLVVKYEKHLKAMGETLREEAALPPISKATIRDAADELGMMAGRHEDVDAFREVMGLSAREASPQTIDEWMEKAKGIDPDRVATRVLSEDGGVASAAEQAALTVRLNGLRMELQAARSAEDSEAFKGILDQVNRYADALDKAGSEAGRAMNVRRVIMNDVFDEWSLTRALEKDANRAAKDSEIETIRNLVEENDTLTRQLEEAKVAAAEARASASVGRKRSNVARDPNEIRARKSAAAKTISEEVQRLLASPVSMVLGAGAPGAGGANLSRLGAALRDYAAALVDEGIVGLENVVGAIKEAFPALERQQIIDAMADYGSEPRTLSEAQKELSRLRQELKKASTKGQGQLAEKAAKAQAAKRSTIEANRAKARLKQAEKLEREGKKSEAKALRADIESRAKAQRELDDEATRLDEAAAKQQQKQFDRESDLRAKIAEYERKIKSGDFAPKTKEELAKSKRVEFLEARRDLVRKRFDSMRNTAKSKDSVAFKVVKGAADTMRSAQLGFDLGAILRQGMFGISHPKKMLMSVRDGLKSMRSDEALQVIQNRLESGEINGKPATAIRSKAGLYMADTLSAPEETFISGLISKIPGIGKVYDAGERFTTGFLNTYRAEMFDSFAKRHPDATPDELKDWARWINSTSGRSNLREVPKIASVLLTSPRYAASRFEVLGRIVASPALLKNKAEREVFIEAVKTGATIIGAMKMAEAAGAEINFDPKSSDFLKIRVGDTVYDPTAGLGGTARLLIRSMMPIFTGEKTKFGKDVASEVGKFSTYKVGPGLSTLYETRTGQTLSGFDVPEDEKGWNAFLPVIVAQAKENIKSDGLAKGLLKTAPEVIGIGSNTYKKKGD